MKQVLKAWYEKILEFLVQAECIMAPLDSNLFVKKQDLKLAVVLICVDGLIITRDDVQEIQKNKKNLSIRLQMKRLDKLKHFLGLEVKETEDGLFLCQQKYARELLQKFGLQ